ncbi:single-stranded DNA-binding protein [Xanthovirga aplysinae]|uniref:single-stranded DNA-binding protein n=1 Tax=Xanthovirga aplysinae TaxID=2529853 RepID=UPI0012BBA99A|nr:single-stranded DNA-binding protein [Xanthovirga aplysinae]MTI31473.1 single-stranded DNA-binding protein [Xanthovirga aplysinae]
MVGVNKAILIGRLGKDPEIRHLESGVAVANFTLATSESYTKRETGQKVEQTEWHNIVAWRRLAEITEQYLKKGSLVYIEGKITTRQWDDKEGNKRYTTEIVAQNLSMLDTKGQVAEGTSSPSASINSGATQPASPLEENTEDDLPF